MLDYEIEVQDVGVGFRVGRFALNDGAPNICEQIEDRRSGFHADFIDAVERSGVDVVIGDLRERDEICPAFVGSSACWQLPRDGDGVSLASELETRMTIDHFLCDALNRDDFALKELQSAGIDPEDAPVISDMIDVDEFFVKFHKAGVGTSSLYRELIRKVQDRLGRRILSIVWDRPKIVFSKRFGVGHWKALFDDEEVGHHSTALPHSDEGVGDSDIHVMARISGDDRLYRAIFNAEGAGVDSRSV